MIRGAKQIFLYFQYLSNLWNHSLIPACGRQGYNQRFLVFSEISLKISLKISLTRLPILCIRYPT